MNLILPIFVTKKMAEPIQLRNTTMKKTHTPTTTKKPVHKRAKAVRSAKAPKSLWSRLRRDPKKLTAVTLAILVVPTLFAFMFARERYVLPATSMGNIYTKPATVTVKKGQAVKLTIRIEPGTPVDTTTASVQYDASQLQYKSVSYEGSPFSTQIPAIAEASKVTVQAAKFGGSPVSSDSAVAVLNFSALKDGTATFTLSGNAARSGSATYPTLNGQPVTINGEVLPKGVAGGSVVVAGKDNAASSAPVELTKNILTKLGLPEYRAASMAPILFITVSGAVLVAFGYVIFLITMRRGLPKKGNIYQGGNGVSR